MSILAAKTTFVSFGSFTIEGLLFSDGSFGVSVPQINELISFGASNNTVSRDLKRILGNDFCPSKAKIEGLNQLINTLTLEQLEKLILKLDRAGNIKAQQFRDDLVSLSLHQLFSDAFDIKFEKEDRQQWLAKRQQTKQSFWWFTDEIKLWLDSREIPSSRPQAHYIMSFKAMSVGLFGKEPKIIKAELGIKDSDLNRDHFGTESLSRIEIVQRLAKVYLANGDRPKESVERAIREYQWAILNYKD